MSVENLTEAGNASAGAKTQARSDNGSDADGGQQTAHAAQSCRRLLREALTGALATLDAATGHPYASLVTVATDPDGTPLMLLSGLARHTQNLTRDNRVSLLIDGTAGLADPLTGGRMTLVGAIEPASGATYRRRFLARHVDAKGYADFKDFAFYALRPERVHFIGGFGRIVTVGWSDVRTDISLAGALVASEPEIIEALAGKHADLAARLSHAAGQSPDQSWRITGLDPAGMDLIGAGKAMRIEFSEPVNNLADAEQAIVRLLPG